MRRERECAGVREHACARKGEGERERDNDRGNTREMERMRERVRARARERAVTEQLVESAA